MESQYIRVRGRVLGPYDREKLIGMARRGQLSRLHELSADGVSWTRASNYPELFNSGGGGGMESRALESFDSASSSGSGFKPVSTSSSATATATSPAADSKWHYAIHGAQAGPIDFATLQQMAQAGYLSPGDQIWTDGWEKWQPASSTPGLKFGSAKSTTATTTSNPYASTAHGGAGSEEHSGAVDDLPPDLVQAVLSTRGWTMFLAIYGFVIAGLCVLVCVGVAIASRTMPNANGPHQNHLAIVMIYLFIGAIHAVGGSYLLLYSNRVAGLHYSRSSVVLTRAFKSLKAFWIVVSIVVLVSIVLMLGFAFFLVSLTRQL